MTTLTLACPMGHPIALWRTEEAAGELGIAPRSLRQLAAARGLGIKLGRDLLFTPADIDAMRVRKPGRPRSHNVTAS